MIIETFILCLTTIIMTIVEFKHNKIRKPYGDGTAYSNLGDYSPDDLMDELRKRFGQGGIDDFLKML